MGSEFPMGFLNAAIWHIFPSPKFPTPSSVQPLIIPYFRKLSERFNTFERLRTEHNVDSSGFVRNTSHFYKVFTRGNWLMSPLWNNCHFLGFIHQFSWQVKYPSFFESSDISDYNACERLQNLINSSVHDIVFIWIFVRIIHNNLYANLWQVNPGVWGLPESVSITDVTRNGTIMTTKRPICPQDGWSHSRAPLTPRESSWKKCEY